LRNAIALPCRTLVGNHVIVVGGGLSGLATALYLARAGRTVTVFEKRRNLGGRAVTHLRHGFRFNLGPHGVYRAGGAMKVYRELGVPAVGRVPRKRGSVGLFENRRYKLPFGPWSMLTTSFLTPKAKMEGLGLFLRIRGLKNADQYHDVSQREWLDTNVHDDGLRLVVESLMRLATYSDAPDRQSAAVALRQLRISMKGVLYIDEGWQKIVDSLHSHCVASGVNFVTSSRVVRVVHDGAVKAIELGGLELDDRLDTVSLALPDPGVEGDTGTRLPAETVVLAVDPISAHELAGDPINDDFEAVTAACLDVALSRLPVARANFALGIDRPLYFSVHSATAQLTPKGGALIHVAKYRKQRTATREVDLESVDDAPRVALSDTERELESLLDEMQPGWREVLVHRRFLPVMTVSNALVKPSMKRPDPVTPIRGLYLAGDWVGDEGILSDAALMSARTAAKAILAAG
jgi:phytoene dehydrogenase-like protein